MPRGDDGDHDQRRGPGRRCCCGYTGDRPVERALAFIAAHPGEVAFITIDIGVNDVLSCR